MSAFCIRLTIQSLRPVPAMLVISAILVFALQLAMLMRLMSMETVFVARDTILLAIAVDFVLPLKHMTVLTASATPPVKLIKFGTKQLGLVAASQDIT